MRSLLVISVSVLFFGFAFDAQAAGFQCGDLSGKTFAGPEGQGGAKRDGCEACETDGVIKFVDATRAEVIWPANYNGASCTYDASENPVMLSCEVRGARPLTFSDDCRMITWRNYTFELVP